jgi:uncharacterized protein (DUF302 family)
MAQAMAADGLITIKSGFGPEETMNRFEAEVRAKGMTVFAHIDHAAGAAAVGTPLMQSVQTIAIDLPPKALVWQDVAGTTWLSYNDPAWLTHRHGLDEQAKATVNAMMVALNAVATRATSPP